MPVAQYCRRLQQLANAMADVGEPVSDRSLTLQLVRGLRRRCHVMATLLPMQQPFPTFVQARSRLLLEEIGVLERERVAGASALTVGGSSCGSSFTDAPPSSPHDKGKAPLFGDRQHGGRGNGAQQPWLALASPSLAAGSVPWR
ncbi:hypothetical protein ZWY2020_037809 [Hordeum vulgare]|nr:hypothetical protein ZWY2020_037809 [Hordeum vulgare]